MSDSSLDFGLVSVRLVQGSIAERSVDALVNAANHLLQMGGGVAAAQRSKGGIEIHQKAIRNAPAAIGSVVRTGAGALPARYVYHAVVIDYDVSKGRAASDVTVVTKRVVALAEEDGIQSIALPLFGAGVGGLSVEQSLTTILRALEECAASLERRLLVEVAVLDDETYQQARSVFEEFLPKEAREREEDRLAEEFLRSLLEGRAREGN